MNINNMCYFDINCMSGPFVFFLWGVVDGFLAYCACVLGFNFAISYKTILYSLQSYLVYMYMLRSDECVTLLYYLFKSEYVL